VESEEQKLSLKASIFKGELCKSAMEVQSRSLTLQEFLALPDEDQGYEFFAGQATRKMSPKFFHASVQSALLILLSQWCQGKGRVRTEWSVLLKHENQDWVPTPDLTYVSFERLPRSWSRDEACPVLPELVIEIISPGQTFGQLISKATNYLTAGIAQVWVIDASARTITVFSPETLPMTFSGSQPLTGLVLTDFALTPQQLFKQSELG
jgi:Uma2 family endonuclease